ncbi:MAG: ROK family protein [Candidatus Sumerlaea chitinivorans]|nr:ROK family protein [Candidatus Sumerlaea chitinivorans]
MLTLGIDLGGTDTKYGLVDFSGRIVREAVHPTKAHLGFEKVMELVAIHARELIGTERVTAVGMGVPGPMSSRTGVVFEAPNLPGWNHVPVRDVLERALGLPVVVHNDANAAAYGEFWAGAGRGCENMILFSLGTGVGGGIILRGELYTGPDDTAGELGHMCINFEGPPCNCGSRGCLEAYASATAIRRVVREAIASGRLTRIRIPEGKENSFGAKIVYEAALEGDPLAIEVLQNVGIALGIAAGSIINIFNPERIVYSGALTGAGEFIFGPLRKYATSHAFRRPAERVEILVAKLGSKAGMVGAAGLAMKTRREANNP